MKPKGPAEIAAAIRSEESAEHRNLRAFLLRRIDGDRHDAPLGLWSSARDHGLIDDERGYLTPLGREVADLLRPKPWRVWPLPWSQESLSDEWGVGHAPRWMARCTTQVDAERIALLLTADDLARAKDYMTGLQS